MSDSRKVSRREFVTSAMSVAAISSLPSQPVFAGLNQPNSASAAMQPGGSCSHRQPILERPGDRESGQVSVCQVA